MNKKIILFLISAILVINLTGCVSQKSEPVVSLTQEYFDTVVTISIYSCRKDENPTEIINECFRLCGKYENLFSRTIEGSEVDKINHSQSKEIQVNTDVAAIISDSIHYSEISEGAFDITVAPLSILWNFTGDSPSVPLKKEINKALSHVNYKNITVEGDFVTLTNQSAELDLGGIAKGFVADKVKSYMISMGVTSAIIDLGGNILTIGSNNNGKDFKIGIKKPFGNADEYSAIVDISNKSVVTSGIYERYFYQDDILYHHILDTNTGFPVKNNLYSVTIISNSSEDGDAISTACLVLGQEKGIKLIESLDDIEAIFINNKNQIKLSSGLLMDSKNRLTIKD